MAKATFSRDSNRVDLPGGRYLTETDMPKSFQGVHALHPDAMGPSAAKRLKVYDPSVPEKRRIPGKNRPATYATGPYGGPDYDQRLTSSQRKGNIAKDPKGEAGLVGYADIYREPERLVPDRENKVVHVVNRTHVGYTQVPDHLRGGGIGSQMMNYVLDTTPSSGTYPVNLGSVASKNLARWAEKKNAAQPDTVHWYPHRFLSE